MNIFFKKYFVVQNIHYFCVNTSEMLSANKNISQIRATPCCVCLHSEVLAFKPKTKVLGFVFFITFQKKFD